MEHCAHSVRLSEESPSSYLSYDPNALLYVLVNAVKEQQKIIDSQKVKTDALAQKVEVQGNKISALENKLNELTGAATSSTSTTNSSHVKSVTLSNHAMEEPLLFQNIPNPAIGTATIKYYIPDQTKSAQLMIVETGSGKVLKRIDISEHGFGTLNLNIAELAAGQYSYTLIIDGKPELNRNMVVSR